MVLLNSVQRFASGCVFVAISFLLALLPRRGWNPGFAPAECGDPQRCGNLHRKFVVSTLNVRFFSGFPN